MLFLGAFNGGSLSNLVVVSISSCISFVILVMRFLVPDLSLEIIESLSIVLSKFSSEHDNLISLSLNFISKLKVSQLILILNFFLFLCWYS